MPAATEHVTVRVACTSCNGAVELECKGFPGFWGYPSFFEYLCPHCGKQNHAKTSGTIVSAMAVAGQVDRSPASY
jgi:hypothetical protein